MKFATLAIAALVLGIGSDSAFAQGGKARIRDKKTLEERIGVNGRAEAVERQEAVDARNREAEKASVDKDKILSTADSNRISNGINRAGERVVDKAEAGSLASSALSGLAVRTDVAAETVAAVSEVESRIASNPALKAFWNMGFVKTCVEAPAETREGEETDRLSGEALDNLVGKVMPNVRGTTVQEVADSTVEQLDRVFTASEELREELRAQGATDKEIELADACARFDGITQEKKGPNGCPIGKRVRAKSCGAVARFAVSAN